MRLHLPDGKEHRTEQSETSLRGRIREGRHAVSAAPGAEAVGSLRRAASIDSDRQGSSRREAGPARRAASMALDLLFPRRCPVCDRPVRPFGALICRDCSGRFVRVGEMSCRCCGKLIREGTSALCRDCAAGTHVFRRGAAVFTYRSTAGAIYRFKYRGRQEYADYFAREMAETLREKLSDDFRIRADMLVPVPVHRARLIRRGYNQAALLARGMERQLGIPCREDVLERSENTAPMRNMSAAGRRRNLKSAFHTCSDDVKSKTILLIDDVYTTGSTMDACAAALQRGGAGSVYFMVLATGEQGGPDAE